MVKVFFAFIFTLFLITIDPFYAQSGDIGNSKIYSGYLHLDPARMRTSLWQAIWGRKPAHHEQDQEDRQCFIEFKSPLPFFHESVAALPDKLTYWIRFKNGHEGISGAVKGEDLFKKFIIIIYTDDEESFPVDPDAEGKQIGVAGEHHIFDPFLIYLILGQKIDHLEIISTSNDQKDKYVLDKLEIKNEH